MRYNRWRTKIPVLPQNYIVENTSGFHVPGADAALAVFSLSQGWKIRNCSVRQDPAAPQACCADVDLQI